MHDCTFQFDFIGIPILRIAQQLSLLFCKITRTKKIKSLRLIFKLLHRERSRASNVHNLSKNCFTTISLDVKVEKRGVTTCFFTCNFTDNELVVGATIVAPFVVSYQYEFDAHKPHYFFEQSWQENNGHTKLPQRLFQSSRIRLWILLKPFGTVRNLHLQIQCTSKSEIIQRNTTNFMREEYNLHITIRR